MNAFAMDAQKRVHLSIRYLVDIERSKARSIDQTSITSSKHMQTCHCDCPLCMTRVYWGCVERSKVRPTAVRANARSELEHIHIGSLLNITTLPSYVNVHNKQSNWHEV